MFKREEMVVGYDSALGYQWVELPYIGDKFAMVAYLPIDTAYKAIISLDRILTNKTVWLQKHIRILFASFTIIFIFRAEILYLIAFMLPHI